MSSNRLARYGAAALVLAGMTLGAVPAAHAQIMSVALPGQEAAVMSGGSGATNRTIGVAVFPYAPWRFDVKNVGAATADGFLLAVEASFAAPEGKTGGYGFGGWYWNSSESGIGDTFELHGKYYFTQKLGVQVGYVGFTKPSDSGYDAYLTYNLASMPSDPATGKGGYSAELGGGVYKDAGGSYGTAFLAGSYDVAKNISVNGSVWYVGDSNFSATRIGLGIGYKFQ